MNPQHAQMLRLFHKRLLLNLAHVVEVEKEKKLFDRLRCKVGQALENLAQLVAGDAPIAILIGEAAVHDVEQALRQPVLALVRLHLALVDGHQEIERVERQSCPVDRVRVVALVGLFHQRQVPGRACEPHVLALYRCEEIERVGQLDDCPVRQGLLRDFVLGETVRCQAALLAQEKRELEEGDVGVVRPVRIVRQPLAQPRHAVAKDRQVRMPQVVRKRAILVSG
mmetsp:Transcript_37810/g.104413  ORF Transcript_37810/g.104413 Transcript_37810/m.104413 type:complete len:225 (-) Transcript_37810:832-1506(-)